MSVKNGVYVSGNYEETYGFVVLGEAERIAKWYEGDAYKSLVEASGLELTEFGGVDPSNISEDELKSFVDEVREKMIAAGFDCGPTKTQPRYDFVLEAFGEKRAEIWQKQKERDESVIQVEDVCEVSKMNYDPEHEEYDPNN